MGTHSQCGLCGNTDPHTLGQRRRRYMDGTREIRVHFPGRECFKCGAIGYARMTSSSWIWLSPAAAQCFEDLQPLDIRKAVEELAQRIEGDQP